MKGVEEVIVLAPDARALGAFEELAERIEPTVAPIPVRVLRAWDWRAAPKPKPGAALVAGGQAETLALLRAGERWAWFHLTSSGSDAVAGWPALPGDPLVTCSRGVNARSVAEWALAAMLHFYRDFDRYVEQSRARTWQRHWSRELAGRTVTVLGAGAAGSRLAELASGLGMRTVGISRSGSPLKGFDEVVAISELDRVWGEGDVTVVLLPLNEETRNAVDALRIAALREGSILLAASRGHVVDEDALAAAVARGHLAGAAVDVFGEEPLPPSSPLWDQPRILVTPHVAGTTDRFMELTAGIVGHVWGCDPMDVEESELRTFVVGR